MCFLCVVRAEVWEQRRSSTRSRRRRSGRKWGFGGQDWLWDVITDCNCKEVLTNPFIKYRTSIICHANSLCVTTYLCDTVFSLLTTLISHVLLSFKISSFLLRLWFLKKLCQPQILHNEELNEKINCQYNGLDWLRKPTRYFCENARSLYTDY
jgi:hypothetical protein